MYFCVAQVAKFTQNYFMPFSSFGLSDALVTTLTELKYERPYPVQEKVIPAIQTQKDVLVIAPTGSGKP